VRRRSLVRALAVPVAAAGIAAGAFAAPAAQAQTTSIDTSGTVAITIPLSLVAQLEKAGICVFPTPASELSVNTTTGTATITSPVSGGSADVSVLYGTLYLDGQLHFTRNGHPTEAANLNGLHLDIGNAEFDATPKGSTTPVVLLDASGDITTSVTPGTTSTTDTYASDQLVLDPAGAAYLDSALDTTAFSAGQTVGTLSATWTVVYPN
jgi:hypothetical protein